MPVTHHDEVNVVAGDDWTIPGTLLDTNGLPLDLSGAQLQWVMLDQDGLQLDDLIAASDLSITDAVNGLVSVKVPRAQTANLSAGRYHDTMRVIMTGPDLLATMWVGVILVDADPMNVPII